MSSLAHEIVPMADLAHRQLVRASWVTALGVWHTNLVIVLASQQLQRRTPQVS